ncbi:MAG: GIY-YIG nuclease family protein [Anaerovoracaceae bacterium]
MEYVYVLRCGDNTLYTGWTNDIKKRLTAHFQGRGAKYTRGRGPLHLVHLEVFEDRSEAKRRENQIKRMNRTQKLFLIRQTEIETEELKRQLGL